MSFVLAVVKVAKRDVTAVRSLAKLQTQITSLIVFSNKRDNTALIIAGLKYSLSPLN